MIIDSLGGTMARAAAVDGGRWRLELTAPAGPAIVATSPNGDAAFDALRSWSADDDWWREAFTWSPLP
ncbi:hypothetical protein K1T35_34610 [Pseudonocardia sp. DSM 110487]|uniref:hypothetical protein n=1 Tax=Pseudonocardia sp. DSM 110487 TaxID=2865833 RepID=UPI001C69549F|nr:hypothetical protein [Pseudonocardia sp. DSM 110487]QYN33585.1 hypothetical protein K1T35_34610 [Pseudonocardia sp. DSM 110487]